jgi:peptide/nickel transport system permease protein
VTAYLVRRVLQSILVIILVSLVTFTLLHLLPGGPARAILGPRATQLQLQQFTVQNHYDKPLIVQFGLWFNDLLHGNLGYSYHLNENVASLIADRLPKTIVLMLLSIVVALLIAIPLGVYQARKRNTVGDYFLTGFSFLFYAMPSFLLGLLLIILFSFVLPWFSPEAPQSDSLGAILADGNALVLPLATLALITVAAFSRYTRSSVMENLTQD